MLKMTTGATKMNDKIKETERLN
uniref:Uncharacterized protein n=1 Tax=Rhizophora mucronata TaxID=61149 RepID=A0A2P2N8G8_RHIMU